MPMWHCPHCGTPQPESSWCWVCRRSSTCCATCVQYSPSVAPGFAFCGLDPRRTPLTGDEIRPCWTPGTVDRPADEEAAGEAATRRTARTSVRSGRDFVPVEALAMRTGGTAEPTEAEASPVEAAVIVVPVGSTGSDGWSLFPELDG